MAGQTQHACTTEISTQIFLCGPEWQEAVGEPGKISSIFLMAFEILQRANFCQTLSAMKLGLVSEVSWSQASAVRVQMGQKTVMEGQGERTDCVIKCNAFFLITLLSSNHFFRAALS